MAQYYDNAVKYVMLGHSQEFAEFMIGHSNITVLEKLETEQPTIKTHQNDSTLKVQLPDEMAIFHTEVQTTDSRKPMWYRLAGYNGYLINLHQMPVYCNVLYLHPNAGKNNKGHYTYKAMGYEYTLRYKVIRLIEIDGEPILEKQVPGLLPFTPLMKSPEGMDSNRWLKKCIEATSSVSIDQNTRYILLAALGTFSGLVYEPDLIIRYLPEDIMQESPFIQYCIQKYSTDIKKEAYTEGIEKGREEGEKNGTIQSIITLLEMQFKPEAVQTLKPTLEQIDDMQRLRELLLVTPQVDNIEAFMQFLANGNTSNGSKTRS